MSHSMRGDEVASDLISSKEMIALTQRFPTRFLFPELETTHSIPAPDLWDKWDEMRSGPYPQMGPILVGTKSCLVKPSPDETGLCNMCHKIFSQETLSTLHQQPLSYERYAHHRKLGELFDAACGGCIICKILWANIMGTDDYVPEFGDERKFEYLTFTVTKDDTDGNGLYYTLNFVYLGNQREWDRNICRRMQICVVPKNAFEIPIDDLGPTKSLEETQTTRLQFAARCLDNCFQQHLKCGLTQTSWRPTRLIDLGSLDGPLSARLVVFSDNQSGPKEPYATLSHRWGSAEMPRLTTKGLAALCQAIVIETLPKTFQDAFVAMKTLKLRYIWIDSLCIMQDSEDDWHKESALMAEVYQNASFNISSTGGLDSTAGLYPPCRFPTDMPYKIELSQSYTWAAGEYYIVNPRFWSSGVSERPLNKRGWVFQERVLAQRVLHFGTEQLYFECKEIDSCENFPLGIPNIKPFQQRTLGLASNGRFKRQDPDIDGAWLREENSMGRLTSDPALNAYSLWNELVEAYSMLELTKVSDKLVAISGVAKYMRRQLDDTYLAGLWRKHLPYHLLWTKRRDIPMNTEPIDYIAPTWSWASIHEKITMYPVSHSQREKIVMRIVDAETFATTADDTGQLAGGCIKATAHLRKCVIGVLKLYNTPTERWQIRMKSPRLWLEGDDPSQIYVWPDELDNIYSSENPAFRHHGQAYCMPVHVWWNDEGDCCTEGLILKTVSAQPSTWDQGIYKRFGRFKIALANRKDTLGFWGVGSEVLIRRCEEGKELPLEESEVSIV
ncbi:heterokaryon incompatibility protein-domain-containing protein [Tricladium varicosporioides]|nr:heterokaryon incompatibility protein-domain-containing protein [Hymenoscyphus varicosporioides]